MSDEIVLGNTRYVSSKRAAREGGYAQDYVGQLARNGLIDAQRVGGLWYVSMDSLQAYRHNADAYKPQIPQGVKSPQEADTIVSFDGKDYVTASKGAKLTGYNPDYVGQLARAGKILSRQVGNRWYVERDGLIAHKKQKDSLLAAVQAESAGLVRPAVTPIMPLQQPSVPETYLTYIPEDDRALLPQLNRPEPLKEKEIAEHSFPVNAVPIRITASPSVQTAPIAPSRKSARPRIPRKAISVAIKSVAALTVVIVISYGFTTLSQKSTYAALDFTPEGGLQVVSASATQAFDALFSQLEKFIVPEITYSRAR